MKIGVFDSGLGGLLMMKSLTEVLPQYDFVYLGDTMRLPYGSRSHETVFKFVRQAVDYLFREHDCALIVLACNTASARALRRLQQEYLPEHYPDRRVLGVIIPTAESVVENHSNPVGVIATHGTVRSETFVTEIQKLSPDQMVMQVPAPLLVPLIEEGGEKWMDDILKSYLQPLLELKIKQVVLGCTHYSLIKSNVKKMVGPKVKVVCQNDIVPGKLKDYLTRHPEMDKRLSKKSTRTFLVTDLTRNYTAAAKKLYGDTIKLELVDI